MKKQSNYEQPRTNFNIDVNPVTKIEKKEQKKSIRQERVNINIVQKVKKYK